MRRLIRDVMSIAAGLLTAVLCANLIGLAGLFAATHGMQTAVSVTLARGANYVLVPLAAGLVLGAFRPRRPVLLAVLLVVASLLGTYRSLGPAGLPHGWKIVAYLAQTAIVAIAAIWQRHRPTPASVPSGRAREAAGLTNAEADKRSEEARFARYDPNRLQLS